MGMAVCGGAMLLCSFGAGPGTFNVLPVNMVQTSMPLANIMDNKPIVNIAPFPMCMSPTLMIKTPAGPVPVPCIPAISAPWTPGSATVTIKGNPALNNTCTCTCTSGGGVITITNPGQTSIMVP